MNAEFFKELIKLFFDKGVLALALLFIGYFITKSVEKIKSDEAFKMK